jgi:hypothetical protein
MNGADHETFWVSTMGDRHCEPCCSPKVQYRAKFVEYKGEYFVKPISNRLFCIECGGHVGTVPSLRQVIDNSGSRVEIAGVEIDLQHVA